MAESIEVSCKTVKSKLDAGDDLLLLDCREQTEHDTASIKAAHLLPMSELTSRVGELDSHRSREIIVMCHHGMRSAQVAAWLKSQKFENVQSMAGGIDRWSEEIDNSVPRY